MIKFYFISLYFKAKSYLIRLDKRWDKYRTEYQVDSWIKNRRFFRRENDKLEEYNNQKLVKTHNNAISAASVKVD